MPENRNFTIRHPYEGLVTNVSPESADVKNTVFHAVNVEGRIRRGTATFGSRDKYESASDDIYVAPTDPEFWAIGSAVIAIGDAAICATYTEPVTETPAIDTAEPDKYYRDRKILKHENLTFYSRVHDYDDFDFGATVEDASRATAVQVQESPKVSGTVTCVIPFNDRACWIFTARSVWLLVGDPVDPSNLQLKSYNVGTFSQGSADVTDVGEVYFLSREGLCSCGLEGRVQNVSEDTIPGAFAETDGVVAFDDLRQKVYAFTASFSCQMDLRTKAFFEIEVASLPVRRTRSDDGTLLFVDGDGVAMKFSKGEICETDWSVVFGPYAIAQNFRVGVVHELQGALSGGTCNMEVITGKSASACLTTAEAFLGSTGSFTASAIGFNRIKRPRSRGSWFCLVLQGTGLFEMERFTVMSTMTGRLR